MAGVKESSRKKVNKQLTAWELSRNSWNKLLSKPKRTGNGCSKMMANVAKKCAKSASSRLPDVAFFMRNWLFGENLAILLQKCDPKVMAIFQSESWHFFANLGQKWLKEASKCGLFMRNMGLPTKRPFCAWKIGQFLLLSSKSSLKTAKNAQILCVKRKKCSKCSLLLF